MADYDYTWKILVLGDPSTGKEELIMKYISGHIREDVKMTIGVDFYLKTTTYNDKNVKLQIWDVGGEERFRFLLNQYCRGASGTIIMYDITNSKTLEPLSEWIQIIRENAGDIPMMLVGNMFDLENSREVSKQEGIEIARKYDLSTYREVSTKTGYNVEKVFRDFIEILIKYFKYEYPIIYVNKCKEMVSKETKRKFLGLFTRRNVFLKFKPITPNLVIPETSYSSQLGLYKNNWALRLSKGGTIIDTYTFKDKYIVFHKLFHMTHGGFPDQRLIVGWISYKIPDISPYRVIEVARVLVEQAKAYFKRIDENFRQKFINKSKERQQKAEAEARLESVKNAVERIEYLMKENDVLELAIERKYLPEIFNVDILDFSEDGLPTLKSFVLKELFLKGIFTRFYGNVVKFFKKK